MRNPKEVILKSFLNRLPSERKAELVRFLSDQERLELEELPDVEEGEYKSGALLEHVHWSWFLPTLKTYPETEQNLFLSALHPHAAKNLAHALGLNIGGETEEMSNPARLFLRGHLLNSLVGSPDPLLPLDYLPLTPLKELLYFSKKELTRLIDFLSLYDLAYELRQIVETKILKKIYSYLSEEQRKYLKQIMTQKEPAALPRMGLERWDGGEESFRSLLHRRGLTRFGMALSGQDPDFIWYICHQLDIGRGNALLKLCAKEGVSDLAEPITRQIEELLKNRDHLL